MRKFVVTIDGKQYEVGVEEIGATESQPVVVSAPVQEAPKTASKAVSAPDAVTKGTKMEAPMPGMIKAYKVQEGATVKKGDVVLILEAMKMDNDITAVCDGVISFKATVGSNVNSGDVMCIIG